MKPLSERVYDRVPDEAEARGLRDEVAAQDALCAALESHCAALQARGAELERENKTLRFQFSQAQHKLHEENVYGSHGDDWDDCANPMCVAAKAADAKEANDG